MRSWPDVSTGRRTRPSFWTSLQDAVDEIEGGEVALPLAGIEGALGDGRRDQRIFNVRDDGAKGDNNTDDTGSILTAIERAIAVGGGTIYLPGGRQYLFDPTAINKIKLASNVRFLGDGESSVLRVKPNAGNYKAMLAPATDATRIEQVLIEGLCFDQNIDNQLAATQPHGTYARAQAAIFARNAKNLIVQHCWFRCCGMNTVLFNGHGYLDVSGIAINDCRFRFAPLPNATNPGPAWRCYDNSAIYLVAESATVSRNQFDAAPVDGARGCCEFHGPKMTFAENISTGYQTLVNLGTMVSPMDYAAEWLVSGNIGHDLMTGVTGSSAYGTTTERVSVTNNQLHFNTAAHGMPYGWGIAFGGDGDIGGDFSELDISHNLIHYEPDDRTQTWDGVDLDTIGSHMYYSGIWLYAGQDATLSAGRIESNCVVNAPTHALSLGAEGHGTLRDISVGGNILMDCGWARSWTDETPAYLNLTGDLTDIWIHDDNVVIDRGNGSGDSRAYHLIRGSATYSAMDATRVRIDEGRVTGDGAPHLRTWAYARAEVDRAIVKATVAPGTITSTTTFSTTVTMLGAMVADTIVAVPAGGIEDGLFFYAYVSSANTVTLKVRNNTSGNISAASRTWRFRRFRTELDV